MALRAVIVDFNNKLIVTKVEALTDLTSKTFNVSELPPMKVGSVCHTKLSGNAISVGACFITDDFEVGHHVETLEFGVDKTLTIKTQSSVYSVQFIE